MRFAAYRNPPVFAVLLILAATLTVTSGCGETAPKRRKLDPTSDGGPSSNPHSQQEAVALLVSAGARTMDIELGGENRTIIAMNAEQLNESGSIRTEYLELLAEIDSLVLDIRSNRMSNDVLAQIAALDNLKGLLPGSPQITDEGLSQLAQSKSIENLDLSYCATITESGLGSLADMPKLESLVLAGPAYGDGLFDQLAKYPQLKALQIDNTGVTNEGCSGLSKLTHLRELRVMGRELSNGAAEQIGKLKLTKLALVSTQVDSEGLSHLAALNDIEDLSLSGSMKITDSGLAHIGKLAKLRRLNLRFCREITAAGMVHLEKLNQLTYLNVEANGLGDAGVKSLLKGKGELEQLFMSGNTLTDESMATIGTLSKLKLLALARNKITSAGVSHLGNLKLLEELTLNDAKLDAPALGIIGELQQLKMLSLSNTGLNDAGVAKLTKLTKLERLLIANTPVTDKGLGELIDLRNLKLIYAPGTKITEAGMKLHAETNRQCMIQLHR